MGKNKDQNQAWVKLFGARLKAMRLVMGYTQGQFAEKIGANTPNVVSRIELGIADSMTFNHFWGLVWIADQEGVDLEWLIMGKDFAIPSVLTRRLDRKYQSFIDEPIPTAPVVTARPFVITEMVEAGFSLVEPQDVPEDWSKEYVPVIGRLAAGEGIDTIMADQTPPGWAEAFIKLDKPPKGSFAVRVVGRSMEPDFQDGDMIVVDPRKRAKSGICCVVYDEKGTRKARLKRLTIKGGNAILESTNPDFSPVERPLKSIYACFKIHAHLRKIAIRSVENEAEI